MAQINNAYEHNVRPYEYVCFQPFYTSEIDKLWPVYWIFTHYLSTATTARILLVVYLEICRYEVNIICIGIGAQSTLGGTKFLPEKYVLKISKMPEFYMILARKNYKIPEFLWYLSEKFTKFLNFTWFLPENAQILHENCPKNIFPEF